MSKGNTSKSFKTSKTFWILLIVLIITTIIFIIAMVKKNNLPEKDNKLVNELYDYFSTEDLTNCDGLLNYTNKKVLYNSISVESKLCIAYHKTELKNKTAEKFNIKKKKDTCNENGMVFKKDDGTKKCSVEKTLADDINNTYERLFGKNVEKVEKFMIDSTHVCYNKDKYIYCGLSETSTYYLGDSSIYRALKGYKEKSSEIIIYDYFIKIDGDTCLINYNTDLINEKCTKAYKKLKKKDIDYKFLKKYGTIYKHVYKKASDGTYYWYSSEPKNKRV